MRFMSKYMGTACYMSAAGSEAGSSAPSATDTEEKEVAELKERFEKKNKVVALATDDQAIFVKLVSEYGDNVHNWTDGLDESLFTGMALAKADNGSIRLVGLPSKEAVFNDPTVRDAAYRWVLNRIVNAATEDDATAAQFVTVAGNFKQKFDPDSFNFLAKTFVKFLRDQGLTGITKNGLRQSFLSQAFAQTQFPRTTSEQWDTIIDMAASLARKNGYDTSLYDHFKATRNVSAADTTPINLDFGELTKAEDVLEEQLAKENAKNEPASSNANPVPATASA